MKRAENIESACDPKPKCYIATIVVDILQNPDTFASLEVLRKFRNEVLSTDEKYKEVLLKYDTVGLAIARAIEMDPNNYSSTQDVYMSFISPCVKLISDGEYKSAVNLYTEMTESLIRKYVFSFTIGDVAKKEHDQSSGGHGRYVKRQA